MSRVLDDFISRRVGHLLSSFTKSNLIFYGREAYRKDDDWYWSDRNWDRLVETLKVACEVMEEEE